MIKGPVELGSNEEEGESESNVRNQIFGLLQHPKNEVRYSENIFSDFRSVFFRDNPPPLHAFLVLHPLK